MKGNTKSEVTKMDEINYEYWAKHLNVTVEEFKKAKEKVGDNVEEIANNLINSYGLSRIRQKAGF